MAVHSDFGVFGVAFQAAVVEAEPLRAPDAGAHAATTICSTRLCKSSAGHTRVRSNSVVVCNCDSNYGCDHRGAGYVGIVKDATESTARVELHTNCKTIAVDLNAVKELA